MSHTEIFISSGAARYVGGTVTEVNGADISTATYQISLGSFDRPGSTWLTPDISTVGTSVAQRIVKYLVSASTPAGIQPGTYWVWIKVTDASEIEPIRVNQVILR